MYLHVWLLCARITKVRHVHLFITLCDRNTKRTACLKDNSARNTKDLYALYAKKTASVHRSARGETRVNVGLLGAHGTRYAEKLHEFVDESEDEVPRVSGDVRLGDEEAPEDDHQERVKHVAYVAQPAKNNEIWRRFKQK